MNAVDVFTPGKTPTVTLVDDHLQKRRQIFEDALSQGGMLITISGPSKSGKTVFVKNIVGADNLIPVTGAGVGAPADLWMRVFHIIGTAVPGTASNETGSSVALQASGKATGSAFVVKGEVGGSATGTLTTKESQSTSSAVDYLQLLIAEVANTGLVLFIDDFHYMSRELQNDVARQLKEAIDKGVIVVCASVPYHSEDVLRANPDLRGRLVSIDFDYWKPDILRKIPEKGFAELGITADARMIDRWVDEVAGSPQLMQSICLNACFEAGYRSRAMPPRELAPTEDFFKQVCVRTALSADYSSTLEKLKEGPKTRGTERVQYRLKDGTVGDVYTIVLKAIALSPPNLHFRYSELQDRIKQICEGQTPVGSSVTGACLQISHLANDGQPMTIIDWDQNEDVFDVRDPYLIFFMRWSEVQ